MLGIAPPLLTAVNVPGTPATSGAISTVMLVPAGVSAFQFTRVLPARPVGERSSIGLIRVPVAEYAPSTRTVRLLSPASAVALVPVRVTLKIKLTPDRD